MRRFLLLRTKDASATSGTGYVAEGVQFGDGNVCIRWRSDRPSTVVYGGIEDAEWVHGHNGWTTVEWIDAAA